jgi:hypothetical protein
MADTWADYLLLICGGSWNVDRRSETRFEVHFIDKAVAPRPWSREHTMATGDGRFAAKKSDEGRRCK